MKQINLITILYHVALALMILLVLTVGIGTMLEYIAVKLNVPSPDNFLTNGANLFWQIIGYVS